MKRMFLVLTVVLCVTVNILAQEVHGVESKMVCIYNCNPDGTWDWWGGYNNIKRPYFGYEFTNLNSIPVSVEVELYYGSSILGFDLFSTKSFVLKSGESYIFMTSSCGIDEYSEHKHYYVKYKAYKLL